MQIQAIVTDIEGTTTPISFVHEVLFPYAAKRLPEFVQAQAAQPEVRAVLGEAAAELACDPVDLAAISQGLLEWIAQDRKATPLKSLQGMIWRQGYEDGELKGPMYADVAPALRQWQQEGRALHVYSSGSVAAQKLIFGYSSEGDLCPLFSDYFDTRIGHKREVTSYQSIAERIGLPAEKIAFLSDVPEELDAAQAAGMHTAWLLRDSELPNNPAHPVFDSFSGIKWP